MILPLKIALGTIAVLLLSLVGFGWYNQIVALERDVALGRVDGLETAVELASKRAEEKIAQNARLAAILQRRSAREAEALETSRAIQEKINALSGTCTFSDSASRLLWEIYEGADGVPTARRERRGAPVPYASASAAESASE